MNVSLTKKLKLALVALILLLVATILSVFIGYRFIANTPEKLLTAITEQTAMTINRMRQTAIRDGRKEWFLDARSASLSKGGDQALLEDLVITFYMENQEEIELTARRGVLFIKTNDFEISGDIILKNKGYRLRTDKLQYNHKNRIITATEPVEIRGGGMQFTADGMSFDLNTNKTLLEGNVEGSIAFTP